VTPPITMFGRSAAVATEGGDGAIGRHQERKDIEAILLIRWLEPCVVACGLTNEVERMGDSATDVRRCVARHPDQ
jgi:hypothetical protein